MIVKLLAHSQLSYEAFNEFKDVCEEAVSDGQIISLAAIRQCYSHKTACEVLESESKKYFGDKGVEGKRLMNHIIKSGHTSTMEHTHFTFTVEGVSRALLAQLTRHRQLSFSVQSQRYNKFSSDSRSGGFDYAVPHTIDDADKKYSFKQMMIQAQGNYNLLIKMGVPQEDARAVLPNAATCNLVTSGNLRAWLEFYKKRKPGEGGQFEITQFAEAIKNEIVIAEPWTEEYFNL